LFFKRELAVAAMAQNKTAALLIGGTGFAVLGLCLGYKYLWKPEKVVRVGIVSQIFIHPLKSGKTASMTSAECQKLGLRVGDLRDRHWLVVTEDGHMVTGRQEPRLVLVSLTCQGGQVCLNGPNMEELKFPIKQPDNPVIDCSVYRTDIQGRDCGDEASQWLTRFLGGRKTFRLLHFQPEMKAKRPVGRKPLFQQFEQMAYKDIAAVMLLSEASVKDLSSRLGKNLTAAQFRPNIVIGECEAFEEVGSSEEIQIGSVRLHRIMSCGRCTFTTVDPETGIMNRKEPLKTLRSANQMFSKTGILQVGDVVYKISR
uniref:Mitochondrial amidoxime reducing component 1 n=1 Tax=Echeneis naucrates TaxID=173247 RepID=A0A665WKR9_ECHNA